MIRVLTTRYFLGRRVEIDYNVYRVPGDRRWCWAPDAGASGEWYWADQLHEEPWGGC